MIHFAPKVMHFAPKVTAALTATAVLTVRSAVATLQACIAVNQPEPEPVKKRRGAPRGKRPCADKSWFSPRNPPAK